MKRSMIAVVVVALMLLAGATAHAYIQTLTWQTEPVLGTSTYWDGNVIVVTNTGPVVIPFDDPPGDVTTGASMSVFTVGQTVDAGSGVYYTVEGTHYNWSVVYTGPSRTVSYSDVYPGDSGEGFVMNYNDPVSTLTYADVGWWKYTETWTNAANQYDYIQYTTDFEVVTPEPATIIVWSLLGAGSWLGVRVWRRRGQPVGRQPWSDENRQAIHEIIARGEHR
jgi:hypothetical protein